MKRRSKPKLVWNARSIRALRKHKERTQEELAEELGVRQQTISEWETGLYRPRGTSLTLLNIIAERAQFNYRVDQVEEEKER